jgi:hypothetical protein
MKKRFVEICRDAFTVIEMKKPFTVRVEESSLSSLEKVAATYGMEATTYGATIIARFADLKPEFALHALTAIPKEYFRAGPGRPSTAASRTNTDSPQLTA